MMEVVMEILRFAQNDKKNVRMTIRVSERKNEVSIAI